MSIKLIKNKDMRNAFKELLEHQALNPQFKDDNELIDDFFKNTDLINHTTWYKEDIRSHAEIIGVVMTETQVDEVADLLANKTDANVGINWDTIANWIYEVTED